MTIIAIPQKIIIANQAFEVDLTSDAGDEQGELSVLVDGERRGTPKVVTVLDGAASVTVPSGWGSSDDRGRSLTVSAGTPSDPVIIR